MVPVMIEKLRGVTIPPFRFSKTWTFEQIESWLNKRKLWKEIKKIIKNVREKNK